MKRGRQFIRHSQRPHLDVAEGLPSYAEKEQVSALICEKLGYPPDTMPEEIPQKARLKLGMRSQRPPTSLLANLQEIAEFGSRTDWVIDVSATGLELSPREVTRSPPQTASSMRGGESMKPCSCTFDFLPTTASRNEMIALTGTSPEHHRGVAVSRHIAAKRQQRWSTDDSHVRRAGDGSLEVRVFFLGSDSSRLFANGVCEPPYPDARPGLKQFVMGAANEWSKYAGLRFIEVACGKVKPFSVTSGTS